MRRNKRAEGPTREAPRSDGGHSKPLVRVSGADYVEGLRMRRAAVEKTVSVPPTPYCLRPEQAAAFLSISPSSLRRLAARKGLRGIHLGGLRSAVLYRRSDLEALIDQLAEEQGGIQP